MKRVFFVFLTYVFFISLSYSQTNEWAFDHGGSEHEWLWDITVTENGTSYLTGEYTSDSIYFGGKESLYVFDNTLKGAYFAKMDKFGKTKWCKSIYGYLNQPYQRIIVEKNNLYLSGWFDGNPDFDPGSGTAYGNGVQAADGFIAKYDTNGYFQWLNTMKGLYAQTVIESVVSEEGDIYSTGYYSRGFDIYDQSSNPPAHVDMEGGVDIYFMKTDSNGVLEWVKNIGGTDDERPFSMSIDNRGDLYIYGIFSSAVLDIDPGIEEYNLYATGEDNIFFAKFNNNGELIWAKSIPGKMYDFIFDRTSLIKTTKDCEIIITGNFTGSDIDFNPGMDTYNLSSNGSADIFLAKYDSSGNFVFANSFGGSGADYGRALAIDNNNDIILTGNVYSSNADLIPGADSDLISNTFFTAKYDTEGNFLWVEENGGDAVDVDSLNNIYLAVKSTTTDDNDTIKFLGGKECVLKGYGKLDGRTIKYSSGQSINLVVDSTTFNSAYISFNSGRGNKSIVFVKPSNSIEEFPDIDGLDISIGEILYGTNWQCRYVGDSANLKIAGLCSNTEYDVVVLDFVEYNNYPIYFKDISSDNSSTIITEEAPVSELSVGACNYFQSPSNKYIWTTSGRYYDTIPNSTGCDSIIVIDLTINHSTSSTITEMSCGGYTSPSGKLWTVSDTYTDTIPNAAGCDSIITIDLTISNSSYSTINRTSCDSYLSPSGKYTWTESGIYYDTLSNKAGCDSIIRVELTVGAIQYYEKITACQYYISPSNKYIWTESGVYTDTLADCSGCGKIFTIDLSIIEIDNTISVDNTILISNENEADLYSWYNCTTNQSMHSYEQSIEVEDRDMYKVQIQKGDCYSFSECVESDFISFADVTSPDELDVYPNPTSGMVHISANNQFTYLIVRVKNIIGENIMVSTYYSGEIIEFNIEAPAGIYFIEIETEMGKTARKQILKVD